MQIPLFPLPNVVLFPNVVLPLHIFEERYKQMIRACVESGQVFGVVLLRDGAQEETDQTIHKVGTTARIMEVERLDGGRMNILCRGEERFRIHRFIQTLPYWQGEVETFEDEGPGALVDTLYEEVTTLYRKAFNLGVQLKVVSPGELQLPESPVDLSMMVSYVLDVDASEKQALLELNSTERRLRALVQMVDDAIRKLEQQLVYKRISAKVRGNGDLGKPSGSSQPS